MKKNRTEELLKEKLREKGLKVTNQRILILSVLEQNKGRHLTAEDIYELVTQEHPEIGLATVSSDLCTVRSSFYGICSS